MSFGFSVGDFLTTASLIRDLISSLRNASTSSYHELVLELHGLRRALHEIEHLKHPPSQQASVNGIKVAALMCQHPLNEFAGKLKKYESLGVDNGGRFGKRDTLKMWGKKLQWGFSMEEEVARLRAYLAAHVGSLNMRLITQGLTATTISAQQTGEGQVNLQKRVEEFHSDITELHKGVEKYGSIVHGNNSILKRLSGIISGEISFQLKTLVDLVSKVWQSNIQIMTFMIKLQTTSPSPELRYTWVQEPVRFEDALGRVIPIPSEYNWGKLEAIILDQFSMGPGSDKVASGEYELFNTLDNSQILSRSEFEGLTPGMSITMAIIVGQYGERSLDRCPRVGCKSIGIVPNGAGGRTCSTCKSWFNFSQKSLPRPLRPPAFDFSTSSSFKYIQHRDGKRRRLEIGNVGNSQTLDVYRKMRNERRRFKNVYIHFAELPETPLVSNVRHPKQDSQKQKRKRKLTDYCWIPKKQRLLSLSAHDTQYTDILPPNITKSVTQPAITAGLDQDVPMLEAAQLPNDLTVTRVVGSHENSQPYKLETTDENSTVVDIEMSQDIDPLVAWILGISSGPNADAHNTAMGPTHHPKGHADLGARSVSTDQSGQNRIYYPSKAPSAISEPYWLAISPVSSVWAVETAPSEVGEYLESQAPTIKDTEKRIGRRRGPLRPAKAAQAAEMRKIRACLRCKFLKKICDKGEPCAGCKPSHTRIWQVPCTRIDIRDIAYFMKDWTADYERHANRGASVYNIKGFAQKEELLWITYSYGYALPVMACEVYVLDDNCFNVDWTESDHKVLLDFTVTTEKMSAGMEGISTAKLSEYLDQHIDGTFEKFVDDYFEGTPFVTEILKTTHRFYVKEKLPAIRKALKLVVAYNLTVHLTFVERRGEEHPMAGKIEEERSKFKGKTAAPELINFQIKCALASMWRELQKDMLEELSSRYSGVYSGDRLKDWPTIFMLTAILLAVWEEMQFDCHYRVLDPVAVDRFCNDMETTPVGVIVGLFHAISQKLPAFTEWDTRKHSQLLNNNLAVCDAMTEMRAHVSSHEDYLKKRVGTKFDKEDSDCLSNKLLSKLVLRTN